MAIQMRRGAYLDFDPSRMLPGELAVVLSGDDTTDTGKGIYICFSAGDVQRLSTYEEIVREINDALADAPEMAEMVTNAVNAALIAHPEWTTTIQDGAVTTAKLASSAATTAKINNGAVTVEKLNSDVTTFTEASSRTNIASGDGITTIWGKIKKWFTDLKAVAFSGAYTDVSGLTDKTANLDVNSVEASGTIKTTQTGNFSFNGETSTNAKMALRLKNSNRECDFEISQAGNIGVYDTSNSGWVWYSDTSANVYIPHPLYINTIVKTTGGDIVAGNVSSAVGIQYRLKNSVHNVGIHLDASGNFGIWDDTNARWAIRCSASDVATLYSASGAGTALVSTSSDSGKIMAGMNCNSATQVRFYGQFGGTTYSTMYATVSSSDPRLKENIGDTSIDALSIINQIQMHSFDWQNDGKHWDVGFIAPELYEIDPNLAIKPNDEDEGDSYWGVHDFYLVGMLTKAVQELSAENTELKQRLSAVEERLSRLEGNA